MDESFAYQAATASAQNQMAFQERMSNTAYQRAVADAKAAGLNPWIIASNGPASTPTGAEGDYGAQAKEFDYLAGLQAQSALIAEQSVDALKSVAKSAVRSGSKKSQRFYGNGFDKYSGKGKSEMLSPGDIKNKWQLGAYLVQEYGDDAMEIAADLASTSANSAADVQRLYYDALSDSGNPEKRMFDRAFASAFSSFGSYT